MPSDLELLEIEIETLWHKDARGRLAKVRDAGGHAAPHLVLAASGEGWTLAFGSAVPDALAGELQAAFDAEPLATDPSAPPAALVRCQQLLESALGNVERSSGPSYMVPPETSFVSDVDIRLSDGEISDHLRDQDLKRLNWSAEEWAEFIDGDLGPWAFVMEDHRVVSYCHTARLAERGAEAGTWTDPDYRGRGYAAAATAAWAALPAWAGLLAPSGRVLFYSTSADNHSSQRVAERLALPLIGWIWKLMGV